MDEFLAGFEKRARIHESLIGAGLGASLGAGLGYFATNKKQLMRNPSWRSSLETEAKKKNILKGTPAYNKLLDSKVKKSKGLNALVVGGLYGGTGAAIGGVARKSRLQNEAWNEYFKNARSNYRTSGGSGYSTGSRTSGGYRAGSNNFSDSGLSSLHKKLDLTGKEATKAEVKKKFREAARKHHPDRGGSEAKMKDINSAYDSIQTSGWFQKLAYLLFRK